MTRYEVELVIDALLDMGAIDGGEDPDNLADGVAERLELTSPLDG